MDPNVPGQDRGKSRLQHHFKPGTPEAIMSPFSGNLTRFPGTSSSIPPGRPPPRWARGNVYAQSGPGESPC